MPQLITVQKACVIRTKENIATMCQRKCSVSSVGLHALPQPLFIGQHSPVDWTAR